MITKINLDNGEKMIFNLFIIGLILAKLQIIFIVSAFVQFLYLIVYIMSYNDDICTVEEDEQAVKKCKKMVAFLTILIVIAILLPTQSQFIKACTIKGVETSIVEYSANNVDTNLTPDKLLEIIDGAIDKQLNKGE